MAKFTCPFCICEYDKSKVLYVCPDCGGTAAPKTFEREPIKCREGCGGFATVRRCPDCNQIIPQIVFETPYLPISIIGMSNSGKTNYITVMLHELGKASGLRLALKYQTKETLDHQNENYRRIYEEHTFPASTPPGENMPHIWSIMNLQKKQGNNAPAYTFTIYDGSGEDHENNLDFSSTVCRYIQSSKAIILAIDPLMLSNIQKSGVVDPNVMTNSFPREMGETENVVDLIGNMVSYIKTAKGIKATQKLKMPVAVVLTKFDTIINHRSFGPQTLIREKSLNVSNGKVDTTKIEQVDGEIRNWLREIGEDVLIDALDSYFREFCFFGVSSYGAPPINSNTLVNDIRPHRVLDPILWLFKKSKFID